MTRSTLRSRTPRKAPWIARAGCARPSAPWWSCGRRVAGLRSAGALAAALAACALSQSCGDAAAAAPAQGAAGGAAGGDGLHHPLDLTDDLYHRIRAGLFVPECEPLLIRATDHVEGEAPTVALAGVWYRFDGQMGALELETSTSGAIVVHADREALLSHLSITSPRFHHSMTREFLQYPAHPIR